MMIINATLPQLETPEDDVLTMATSGRSYFSDQLHLFEAAGILIYATKSNASRQVSLLEAVVRPLMEAIGAGLRTYQQSTGDVRLKTILQVHHNLLALGNLAKGFPQSDATSLAYQTPFKQMTEALLEALNVMKAERVVRESVCHETHLSL